MNFHQKLVILGGGFAGVEAAIKLREYGYAVTLVSNRDYLFVYPVSIWIPVKKISFNDVKISLPVLAQKHGFELIIDEVTQINSAENKVYLEKLVIPFDYLLVAMGMGKLNMKGLEFTHSICGMPTEAQVIKEELDKLVHSGHGSIAIGFGGNPADPTATSVRGGPAFELLFNFSHYLKKLNLRDKFQITFFAPMAEPGKKMGDKPYRKMDLFFSRYKIDVRKGKKISHFAEGEIHFEDNTVLKSDLIIFIPGGEGHPVVKKSDLPLSKAGFINIDEYCQVEDIPNIYAIGDITALRGPKWAAKQGHIAEVMAKTAAYNIHKQIQGKEKRKEYKKHLNIICVMDSGDGAAFIMRAPDREIIIPLPIIGHWMKKFWGFYYKNSKLKRIPRIPGI
ncbi:MAG: FAD-dependent oxidoreductase [Bacteroidetes bacterium]|jgi:sulfide:quinone oxidoreductase|nr:FAD-dependent oxidoreductase [Bacteroidota bacterium]